MRYLRKNRIFESRFLEFRGVISTLKDICLEFEDNNCYFKIFPESDIKLNIISLNSRGYLNFTEPFYLEIDIDRRIIKPDEKRSGFGSFPEWFIDNCRRIEDFMKSEGFETKPSVRYGTDWENFETIDELSEVIGLIYKVRLQFISNKSDKKIESFKPTGYLKNWKQICRDISYNLIQEKSHIDDMEEYIRDILIELEDIGLQVEIDRTRKDVEGSKTKGHSETFIEVRIMRPWGSSDRVIPGVAAPPSGKYPGNLFFWYEVKDSIIRLNDWYYSYSGNEYTPGISGKTARELEKIGIKYNSNSPFRMFTGGIEFGIGWYKPEDFDLIGDFISFDRLRIEIKV